MGKQNNSVTTKSPILKKDTKLNGIKKQIKKNTSDKSESGVKIEPITVESLDRYSLFPIKYKELDDNYIQQRNRFWTEEEIDFSKDKASWMEMNKDEQTFIANTLAYFANSDNVVIENLGKRFMAEITIPEAQQALAYQTMMEGIHVRAYSQMIDTVITDVTEKNKLHEAIKYNPVVKPKLEWARKWIDSDAPLHVCLCAWAIIEGVFFSSSFASMLWLRECQKCPGICYSNEKILEDECLHVKLSCILKKMCINVMRVDDLHQMMREAVQIEQKFVEDALPYKLKGMNATLMKQYVEKVADTVLEELGETKLYNVSNPFRFLDNIGLIGKTNFFERRTSEYGLTQKETDINTLQVENLGNDLNF